MKNWKKSKVVMLPTEKASEKSICMNQVNGGLFIPERRIHGNKIFEVSNYGRDILGTTPQHLYITNPNEEIKEGDWVLLHDEFVCKYTGYEEGVTGKIIATTDRLLDLKIGKDFNEKRDVLPRPSNEFLKKYCEVGGIDEVLVEYNFIEVRGNGNDLGEKDYYRLKVAPDNTITTIRLVKNTYSKKELIKLCKSAYLKGKEDTNKHPYLFNKWAEENL